MEPVLWFGWFRADIIAEYAELFWQGLRMTVGITAIGIVQGSLLGLLVGMARLADARHAPARQVCRYVLRWPATIYVSFFRGTPLFVQIMLIHFAVVPLLVNPTDGLLLSGDAARDLRQEYGALLSGVIALTLNSGAYISEVFRAGIQSIDRGQREAAFVLGMNYRQTMGEIVLPQAFARILPPFGSSLIIILKESSLASVIAVPELLYQSTVLQASTFRPLEILTVVAVIYFLLTYPLTLLVGWLEERTGARERL
jgi:polar amino acid transport system permease protein